MLEVLWNLGPCLALIPAEVTGLTNSGNLSLSTPNFWVGPNMYTSPGHFMLPSLSTDYHEVSLCSLKFLFYHLGAYRFYLESKQLPK